MNDLRERCAKVLSDFSAGFMNAEERLMWLEAFAREIRNEALEEVANYFDNYIRLEAFEEHWVAEEIRKFKGTTALAAKGNK